MSINIRNAKIEDIKNIKSLCVDTIKKSCYKDYNSKQLNAWVSLISTNDNKWEKAIKSQNFLIAKIDNKIAGFGSLFDGKYIDFLYVGNEFLRQGIANKIFEEFLKKIREWKNQYYGLM